jgi:hypothetical protein
LDGLRSRIGFSPEGELPDGSLFLFSVLSDALPSAPFPAFPEVPPELVVESPLDARPEAGFEAEYFDPDAAFFPDSDDELSFKELKFGL